MDGFREKTMHGLSSKTDEKQGAHTHYTSPVVWPSHCSASRTTLLVSILTNLEKRECVVFA